MASSKKAGTYPLPTGSLASGARSTDPDNALIDELDHEEDARQAYLKLQHRLRDYRNAGRTIPETLARMERVLAMECSAQSQGR